MKKLNSKSILLLIAAIMILTVSVAGTVAYLAAVTGPVVNTFEPTEVDTEIDEDFNGTTKSKIVISNPAGDNKDNKIDVYIRVALVGNWVNQDGEVVAPATDSEISFTIGTDWVKSDSDGYYYYKNKVAPGGATSNLLGSSITASVKADGSYLSLTVIQQAIQAEPKTTVESVWGVTVADDGTISK